MSDTRSYVHNFTDELDVMPLLSRGSNCAVFHTIGLLDASPLGATENAIAKYTCLAIKTVRVSLATLLFNGLVEEAGDGLYHANPKYLEFRGREKKSFSSHDDDDLLFSSSEKNSSIIIHDGAPKVSAEVATVLSEIPIEGNNLNRLASKVSIEIAREWAEWAAHCDRKRFRNPSGFCFMTLDANPKAHPPYWKKDEPEKRKPYISGFIVEQMKHDSE